MGSLIGATNAQPVHMVTVESFEMMRTEITVAQYKKCVDAGVCSVFSTGSTINWGMPGKEDHPMNSVTWLQTMTFAEWVGARLPTEAEWEYAARSLGQPVTYPWGEATPDCSYVDFMDGGVACNGSGTSPVCNTPSGHTEQGLCDMAGNLSEWVLDNYHNDYIGAPPNGSAWCDVATCEDNGEHRVFRGGSWNFNASYLDTTTRTSGSSSFSGLGNGARLARTLDP